MADLHPGQIPQFVKPSRVEPDSKVRLAKLAAKRLTQNGPMRP